VIGLAMGQLPRFARPYGETRPDADLGKARPLWFPRTEALDLAD